jgi:hypothetical protein
MARVIKLDAYTPTALDHLGRVGAHAVYVLCFLSQRAAEAGP